MKKLFLITLILAFNNIVMAQQEVSGRVLDGQTLLPVFGAEIFPEGQSIGTLTDAKGNFTIRMEEKSGPLTIKHLGYAVQQFIPEQYTDNIILLKKHNFELEEIQIISNAATERYNPIAFSSIDGKVISRQLGDKPLPEILNSSPGVYASRDGGGSGDASIALRGFQQENIAVLLNGVPINGAENGLVYWNNWMGLSEVASSIQMQKGIGSSRVALNSVGGTINIITLYPKAEPKVSLTHHMTSYGNKRTTLAYHSGTLDNDWNISFLGSRSSGEGYIDGTYVDGWAYFLNLSKNINAKQRLLISLLGGPERHGQRNFKLSQDEIERFGHRYNKEWGALNGKINNASENFYHKPHLSLSHYLDMGNNSLLATSVYFSPGWGGGKWNDSFNYGPTIFDFRNASGQIAWDEITQYNANHSDSYTLNNGNIVAGFSKAIQTHFLASHFWGGVLSGFEKEYQGGLKISSGVHYRYFHSDLKQEVANLLGGQFYIDDYSWSLAGVAGRDQIKMPGDVIRVHNGAVLHQTTVFAQAEKSFGKLLLFSGFNVSYNTYRRHDVYNYPTNPNSDWIGKSGIDGKLGLLHRTTDASSFFINAAHFSKAPYYKFVFGNNNNEPVINLKNEKVNTVETGYFLQEGNYRLGISGYYTHWQDVSFLTNEYIQLENNSQSRAMVSGLNALHKGIEAEWQQQFTPWFGLAVTASLGDWKWENDVEAKIYNDNNVVADTVKVFAKGLYVGGQPQLQAGLMTMLTLFQNLEVQFQLFYYDKHYALFDPSRRQNPEDRAQSYQIPSATVANIYLQYPVQMAGLKAELSLSINNLFNQLYILKGEDGVNHTLTDFRGFWSFGRTIDVGVRIQLADKGE